SRRALPPSAQSAVAPRTRRGAAAARRSPRGGADASWTGRAARARGCDPPDRGRGGFRAAPGVPPPRSAVPTAARTPCARGARAGPILPNGAGEVGGPRQEGRHQGQRSRRRLELHAPDPPGRESAERDEPGGIEVGAQEALEGEGRRRGGGTPARAMNPRFVG